MPKQQSEVMDHDVIVYIDRPKQNKTCITNLF